MITFLCVVLFFVVVISVLAESKDDNRVTLAFLALGLAGWSSNFEWAQSLASVLFLGIFVVKVLSLSEWSERATVSSFSNQSARKPVFDLGPLLELLLEKTRPAEGERFSDWNERLAAFMEEHTPDLVKQVAWTQSPSSVAFNILTVIEMHCGRERLRELQELLQSD